jgi:hypothetical protein
MLLDLKPEQVPSLDNFVIGGNVELVERLRGLIFSRPPPKAPARSGRW